ncbi:hypothetical protein K432DRAFT_376817 [Lepidopterella palustris CBS 459.81]|uniref:Uncharacterized protein n=1 Tax=Lepidopterella palustris CBS 459.81 TaxID=1314670 RepID=A0A8E2EM49_9PEZI|nr:hypothetical protein K432DRAFT_376817 [Lepidopterella palustris CBS 459.81]
MFLRQQLLLRNQLLLWQIMALLDFILSLRPFILGTLYSIRFCTISNPSTTTSIPPALVRPCDFEHICPITEIDFGFFSVSGCGSFGNTSALSI